MTSIDKKFTFFQYYNTVAITVLVFFAGLAWKDAAIVKAKQAEQVLEIAKNKVILDQNASYILELKQADNNLIKEDKDTKTWVENNFQRKKERTY
jgi:hypothetical protein